MMLYKSGTVFVFTFSSKVYRLYLKRILSLKLILIADVFAADIAQLPLSRWYHHKPVINECNMYNLLYNKLTIDQRSFQFDHSHSFSFGDLRRTNCYFSNKLFNSIQ